MRNPRLKIPNTPPRDGCLACSIQFPAYILYRRYMDIVLLQSFDNRGQQRPFFHLQPDLIRDQRNLIIDVIEVHDEERRFIWICDGQ